MVGLFRELEPNFSTLQNQQKKSRSVIQTPAALQLHDTMQNNNLVFSNVKPGQPEASGANGNGNSHTNGSTGGNGNDYPRRPVIHLRRFQHYAWCGRDLDFFVNLISTQKPSVVTCKVCVQARRKLLTLRKKARAFDRLLQP
jgi:hypothetical protein